MSESVNMESLTSAAAFVEGGIQDACDDSCSICLEEFVDSDPSTVTSCKHEFHLQCILEWCQRSAQCPMCWQDISLKDPTSQELLEAVERERSIRSNQTRRNTAIFHHPALGDFDLQHLSMGGNDDELEERIIQHLAAAASMGRAHHLARREGQRVRSSTRDRQFLFFSAHPNASSTSSVPASSVLAEDEPATPVAAENSSAVLSVTEDNPAHQASATIPSQANQISAGQSTPVGHDKAGPSDFQAFSESLKSRLNSVSTRYKESITKSTRGWKERLFSRNTSVADIGSEVKREVSAGFATVTRMMERLDTRENKTAGTSAQQNVEGHAVPSANSERVMENITHVRPDVTSTSTVCAASPK